MSIGDKWHEFGMGSMDKTSSFKLLDAYFDAGVSFHPYHDGALSGPDPPLQGNFIDTANN